MTTEPIRLCEACEKALRSAGYRLRRVDVFKYPPVAPCEQCGKRTLVKVFRATKGAKT